MNTAISVLVTGFVAILLLIAAANSLCEDEWGGKL